jgi:Protein of unknown function (DUF3187)
VLALAAALLCTADASRAPLGLRTQGPLRELFLDMTSADARSLARPELDVRYSVANTWNEPMTLLQGTHTAQQEMDEQADSLAVRFRAPWSRWLGPAWSRVSTGLEGRLTLHWGGWTDRPIEAWHSLVGAFNYQRASYPRNQVHLLFGDDGGTAFDLQGTTLAFGDVVLRNQITVLESPSSALAIRVDLKLPTGSLSAAGGSGGFDAGVGLLGTTDLTGWLTFHALAFASRFSGLSADTALQPREWHFGAEVSLAASWGATTFLLEDRILTPLLQQGWAREEGGGDDAFLSSGSNADFRAHNQFSFAIRRGRFTLWLSEDFTPGSNDRSVLGWGFTSNAPDVVIGLSFTQPL